MAFIPAAAFAVDPQWKAFDLESCTPWYFDARSLGGSISGVMMERYRKLIGYASIEETAGAYLGSVLAMTDETDTGYYAHCFASKKNNTLQCLGYAHTVCETTNSRRHCWTEEHTWFPLGEAVYRYEQSGRTALPATVRCIKNCKTTRLKLIFDMFDDERGPDGRYRRNGDYAQVQRIAEAQCGQRGRSW